MRVSELIKRLENVKSEHGDLYVLIGQPDCTGEGDGDLVDLTGECLNVETIHSVFQHRVRWGGRSWRKAVWCMDVTRSRCALTMAAYGARKA